MSVLSTWQPTVCVFKADVIIYAPDAQPTWAVHWFMAHACVQWILLFESWTWTVIRICVPRAKVCIAKVMLENRHTGISFGHIISTMFTCRIRISKCQHDQGFMDLFTPMAVSQVSSGPHSVDVDGPQKESRKGTNKKDQTGEGRQSAFTRWASFFWPDNGKQFKSVFYCKCNHRTRLAIKYLSIHYYRNACYVCARCSLPKAIIHVCARCWSQSDCHIHVPRHDMFKKR